MLFRSLSSLTETTLGQVVSCKTSADLWKSLQQSFSSTSRAHLSELKRSLQTITKGGSSCADFCQKICSIADELAFIGSPVPEDDLVMIVLGGLGSEYNSLVTAAHTKETLSFSDLQGMLFTHENLLRTQNGGAGNTSLPSLANPAAFLSNPRPGQRGSYNPRNNQYRQQYNSGSRPRYTNSGPRPRGYSNSGPRPTGPTGHKKFYLQTGHRP